ncbi:type II toxin-antitoxin system prevent-host-death family antitoxin [Acinetobacter sp. ANC 4173]|jgi:antitoxin Phd|uniref:type II toxin-antitoxin system prevent-host-death family antitoxin n=1 Tax=Acinetobacter sp. ANC 4173 TaxID=2529837 RepID=UPI00103E62D3|nr:type II toxin-antitoxin system prevent-host-death family antitoxin [Acinetobacter sp. ANC 4173]TCB81574.1 type II toxin-antitoxin system prevent-host-death family antitoxin [Acinetobacter sp. ANC 4173]
MESFNCSNAKAVLSMIMDKAVAGDPVEITRKGRESAVMISKASYDAYKKAEFEAKFPTTHQESL